MKVHFGQKLDLNKLGIGKYTIEDKYYVIDVEGNHDVFAVDGLFSEYNYFLDFSYIFKREDIKNMDDFIIKEHIYKNITFILFNDYILPTPIHLMV